MYHFIGNDAAEVKPGGLGQEILGNKLSITEFPDMVHGWTTRGGELFLKNLNDTFIVFLISE